MQPTGRPRPAIFFRKRARPFEPAVHWIFADDLDASYNELISLGATIVELLDCAGLLKPVNPRVAKLKLPRGAPPNPQYCAR